MLVSYTLDIDDKCKDKLEKLAVENYRTLAAQIRLVLEEYVDNLK